MEKRKQSEGRERTQKKNEKKAIKIRKTEAKANAKTDLFNEQ